ncbi:MAG: hypothetical protein HC796_06255 [Synechococcaceae cyanobacterium RL_1_2]|nr:hypothetical protein [Synechococcaceae cyanobacterium RL_1_2]
MGSKSFVVNDIILTNLDHSNYQEEIRLVLEDRVNTEVTAWLGENTQIVGYLIIDAILNFAQLLLAS